MPVVEGYRFVPLPDQVHREPRAYACHDRRVEGTAKVVLELTYKVIEPIHIGAGHWTFRGRSPVRMAVRSCGRVMIPGSSLKGVLRSRYEAITNSCCLGRPPHDTKLTQKLPSRTYPGYQVVFGPRIRQHAVFEPCRPNSDLCAACALFGVMSLRARVAVQDLLAPVTAEFDVAKLPVRFSPRPHHLGTYDADKVRQKLVVSELRGRKFYRGNLTTTDVGTEMAEVIPVGTELSGRIACTNITPAELGGLLSTLGFVPPSKLRIGSAKAYQFGLLEPVSLRVAQDLPPGFGDKAREAFEQSPDRHKAGEEHLVWISGGAS